MNKDIVLCKKAQDDYEEALSIAKVHKKSDNPKVTVIVPVYKVDRYLAPCLDSIVNQTLEDIEIIIVDEGDQDRCREIIDYFEKIDPRVVAPHSKNGGYGASCNKGIDMARGEYIAIIESDDMIEREMFEEMYNYAKLLDADVVKTPFCYWNGEDGRDDCEYRYEAAQQCPQGKLFSVKEFDYPLRIHASLWAAIYKTSYMREKNIRFVEAKGGAYVDVGFRIDTLVNTDKMAWLDKPYYLYRTNNDESTTNNFNLTTMLKRWKEAHDKFSLMGDDYKNYYEAALIRDEYLNTLSYMNHADVMFSKEQMAMLKDNFKNIHPEIVENTRSLTAAQKKEILSYLNNPEAHYRNVKRKIRLRNIAEKTEKMYQKLRSDNLIKMEIAAIFCMLLTILNKEYQIFSDANVLNIVVVPILVILIIFIGVSYILWGLHILFAAFRSVVGE